MEKKSVIKILGIAATLGGFMATLLSDWVKDREQDEKIRDNIEKVLSEREES